MHTTTTIIMCKLQYYSFVDISKCISWYSKSRVTYSGSRPAWAQVEAKGSTRTQDQGLKAVLLCVQAASGLTLCNLCCWQFSAII